MLNSIGGTNTFPTFLKKIDYMFGLYNYLFFNSYE